MERKKTEGIIRSVDLTFEEKRTKNDVNETKNEANKVIFRGC